MVAGLVVGTGLALGAAQAAKSLLYGLTPSDPLTGLRYHHALRAGRALDPEDDAVGANRELMSRMG